MYVCMFVIRVVVVRVLGTAECRQSVACIFVYGKNREGEGIVS